MARIHPPVSLRSTSRQDNQKQPAYRRIQTSSYRNVYKQTHIDTYLYRHMHACMHIHIHMRKEPHTSIGRRLHACSYVLPFFTLAVCIAERSYSRTRRNNRYAAKKIPPPLLTSFSSFSARLSCSLPSPQRESSGGEKTIARRRVEEIAGQLGIY